MIFFFPLINEDTNKLKSRNIKNEKIEFPSDKEILDNFKAQFWFSKYTYLNNAKEELKRAKLALIDNNNLQDIKIIIIKNINQYGINLKNFIKNIKIKSGKIILHLNALYTQ
jgi:hypothetical protein